MFTSFNARALGLPITAEATIELAASAGFGGVDLLVRDVVESGSDPRALRARMDGLGLRGGAWPLPVDWRGDEGHFRADLDCLPRHAEAAAILGLTRTCTWVLPELPEPPAAHEAASWRRSIIERHVQRLGAIARILARHGTRLGLEVVGVESSRTGRGEPLFTRLGDETFGDLLEELRRHSPGVGVLVDAFHLYAAGESMAVGWARGVGSVVWVHVADVPASADPDRSALSDRDRGLPGESGAIDAAGLLQGLSRQGYDGPVTAEPMAGCRSLAGRTPEEAAQKVASALRSIWPPASTDPSKSRGRDRA